jgi:hypothetical protein
MEFNAPWSETLGLMSGAGSVVVLAAIALSMMKRPWWLRVTALAVAAAFLIVSWGFAPGGYIVEADRVIVSRPFSDVTIERSNDTKVRLFEDADDEGMKRTAGNGGLFGYYGTYESKRLGSHKWYVTDMARRVVIETRDGAVVVSPDDPQKFIDAVNPSK